MNKIAVVGLGYVGLPLARLFATKYPVIGFDISAQRVRELQAGKDRTLELSDDLLASVLVDSHIGLDPSSTTMRGLYVSSDIACLQEVNIFILAVPTPVDKYQSPDLSHLKMACETVASCLKKADLVIFESTVYPGATEEFCVPLIEQISGLKYNIDFFAGYTPERVNPGDKLHTIEKVKKVTSGSTPAIAQIVDTLYASVIEAGTHLAPSIKVAEAAKVIENAQRDINIAFVNELSKIFNLLNIDTLEVLEAAGTKWNFMPFRPGLVGGHCIGVDPYYLSQKAREVGYNPEIILAGRRVNDGMGEYVASQFIKLMIRKGLGVAGAKILVLGFTFKENCSDCRNTKVIDIVRGIQSYHSSIEVQVYDPWADPVEVKREYNIEIDNEWKAQTYDGIILAVAHKAFESLDLKAAKNKEGILYDVKGFLKKELVDGRL
ncbi:UDP-glucose 6-dehydrogenase [Bacteroidales bacterium]|nr:UDP-glucose 6-dehydrogenase [Bacteroidales bacterium]